MRTFAPKVTQNKNSDFTPLDMTKWKGMGEAPDSLVPYENALYNAEQDSVIVRQRPVEGSKKTDTISCYTSEIPEVFPCLGYVYEKDNYFWFKLKVNGKIGYVAEQFMVWDAINSY